MCIRDRNDAGSFGHMPLYIDENQVQLRLSKPVADALIAIKNDVQNLSVTPSAALGLMKRYLQPLLPIEHQDVFSKFNKPSWVELHWAFPDVAFRGGKSTGLLADIAVSIDLICTYSTFPPRDFPNLEEIEITNFLQMCKHLGIEVEQFIRYANNGKFDIFRSCKYCWRQPVPGRFICATHTAGNKYSPIKLEKGTHLTASSSSAEYKEGKRQKKIFDKLLNQILTKEVWDFHGSEFNSQILLPSAGIWEWLITRRPSLAQLLKEHDVAIDDDNIIESLLVLLHTPEDLSESLLQPYTRTNTLIKSYPFLIWPMLLRAEVWLTVRNDLRNNWGGTRYKRAI